MIKDPRIQSQAKKILEENLIFLEALVDEEIKRVSTAGIQAENPFDLAKKYYTQEGIKQGLRLFLQVLNNTAKE